MQVADAFSQVPNLPHRPSKLLTDRPQFCTRIRLFPYTLGHERYQRVCELDLEGIVAKQKSAPYVTKREQSTWYKILNRGYSQKDGREELFERERHSEPVAGWHVCALACAELEHVNR